MRQLNPYSNLTGVPQGSVLGSCFLSTFSKPELVDLLFVYNVCSGMEMLYTVWSKGVMICSPAGSTGQVNKNGIFIFRTLSMLC